MPRVVFTSHLQRHVRAAESEVNGATVAAALEAGDGRIGKPHFLGDPVSAVLSESKSLYAALNLGHFGVKLHRSDNGGETWSEVAAPAYPPKPEGADDKVPWKLTQIWTLEGAGKDLWAGTIPGGLFHSTDRGESWRLGGKGMYAEFMPPEQRDNPNIQDVHRMVQSASRPEVFWAQHHNGVFHSTDGASSWQEIKAIAPSKFGFVVAVHPQEAGTAWLVPAVKDECRVPVDAKLVVSRTRDGGKSFDVLRRGLPQENAYDLVYRHGLAVDASGSRLAFGSTTGGLWLSEDQGDSWRCLSTHLPPIHCVRFA